MHTHTHTHAPSQVREMRERECVWVKETIIMKMKFSKWASASFIAWLIHIKCVATLHWHVVISVILNGAAVVFVVVVIVVVETITMQYSLQTGFASWMLLPNWYSSTYRMLTKPPIDIQNWTVHCDLASLFYYWLLCATSFNGIFVQFLNGFDWESLNFCGNWNGCSMSNDQFSIILINPYNLSQWSPYKWIWGIVPLLWK